KSYCPYCNRAKQTLDQLGTEYIAWELDNMDDGPAIQNYLSEKTGQRTVPNIFIGKKSIGGSTSTTPTASTNTTVSIGSSASTKHYGINSVAGELSAKRVAKGKEVVGKEIAAVKDYASKEELVSAVSRHYASQSPKEDV
ncbi:3919_t:CDS:2, partial [Racocetra fulgida]